MSDMTERTGGCLCGAVRYTLRAEPVMTVVCHCTHCQKQSGAMFSTNLAIPEAAYEQRGETQVFHDTGDSGKPLRRHFCGACGSPILSSADALPGLLLIKAGTLDDLSTLAPTIEVYTDHAAPFVQPLAGARRFPQAAGRGG